MPNPIAQMTNAESAEYRRWMFASTSDDMPDPNLYDDGDDDNPTVACVQDHAWIAGYRWAKAHPEVGIEDLLAYAREEWLKTRRGLADKLVRYQ